MTVVDPTPRSPVDEASADALMMARFVADYRNLLDERVERIGRQLLAGTDAEARVSLMSLESTSFMAGADGLGILVRALRGALDRGEAHAASRPDGVDDAGSAPPRSGPGRTTQLNPVTVTSR